MNNKKIPSDSLSITQPSQNRSVMQAEILSQTPGRIRIKIASSPHRIEQINLIVIDLKNQLEIERIRTNFHIGTITIFYNPKSINAINILNRLTNLGLVFSDKLKNSSTDSPKYSMATVEVTKVTKNLNQRIRQNTKGLVDLSFLIPLSFGLLAWRQLMVKGWQLKIIPWYVLAWYAFDSFIKLHGMNQPSSHPQNSASYP